jgi:leucyl-tRNA synthetase
MEPVVPHICWELSQKLFTCKNLVPQKVLEEVFEVDTISMGVSVNGKKRSEIEVGVTDSNEKILAIAKESIAKWIEDKEIVKEIVIPNKLVNIVIKG